MRFWHLLIAPFGSEKIALLPMADRLSNRADSVVVDDHPYCLVIFVWRQLCLVFRALTSVFRHGGFFWCNS